ncbi:hypothetical protein [Taibaiella koreensis]|uniref:hypothetical protein n=1 Tax=Taibaiella koreensis TaxID=1268548 RepID=UPI000E59E59A|nr:hypothetical protein [Taibaiella koreensis]
MKATGQYAPVILLLCLGLALGACRSDKGVDLSDKRQLATLPAKIGKYIGPGILVADIQFLPADARYYSNIAGSVQLTYVDPASPEHFKRMRIDLNSGSASEEAASFRNNLEQRAALERAAPISGLDYSVIGAYFAYVARQAAALHKSPAGMRSYSIQMARDPRQIIHTLALIVKSGDQAAASPGRERYGELVFTGKAGDTTRAVPGH